MTWQNAKIAAQAWAEAAGFGGDVRGKMVLLPSFTSEEDCRFFLPDVPLSFHQMMLKAAGRTARKGGAKIVPVLVTPKDYRAWLRAENRADDPDAREAYIRLQTKVV